MMKPILRLIDVAIYLGLFYLAYSFYATYVQTQEAFVALQYDFVFLAALLYTMARRPDVNTITLVLIILLFRVVDIALLHDVENLGGFLNYAVLMLMNVALVIVIWIRPLLFSKFLLWRNNPNLAVTHQDNVLGSLFSLQVVFMFLMLLEHASRRINDWMYENSRLLYNNMEIIQFFLTMSVIAILYYMTFDSAKIKRAQRNISFKK